MAQVFVFEGIVNSGEMESGRLLSGRGTDCRGCGQDRSSDCKVGADFQVSELREGAQAGVPVSLKAKRTQSGRAPSIDASSRLVRLAQAEAYATF